MTSRYVDVVVPLPLRGLFTYSVGEGPTPPVGARVAVPFRGRSTVGVVFAHRDEPPIDASRIRPLRAVLDATPIVPEELLSFLDAAARYYAAPLGEVVRGAMPAVETRTARALRAQDGVGGALLRVRSVAVRERVFVARAPSATLPSGKGPLQKTLWGALPDDGSKVLRDDVAPDDRARAALARLVDAGLVLRHVEDVRDDLVSGEVERDQAKVLSAEQARAVEAIERALRGRTADRFLLHGVTGSGKTEVYLAALAVALAEGGSGLLLVPEIALTPQLVGRVRARFGDAIAVLHSGVEGRVRAQAYEALRTGAVRIAVGARSALFAPMPGLAVVIVDEEHDPSFKQEEGFRYHARDMALLRAAKASAVCILGSATPSFEAYELAERGRLHKLVLRTRPTGASMPSVELVDLRRHRSTPSGHPLLTEPLTTALSRCLDAGEQAMIFLNRRGYAPTLRCLACDEVVECPACDLPLTEHRRERCLRCHTCDHQRPLSESCPSCGAVSLVRVGAGTEAVEEALARLHPSARIARLDRDSARTDGAYAALEAMRTRRADVLVGTQMITKGHDLPGVSLVGVLLADQALAFPDFRAAERTFQLVSQVAGRAGRADTKGRVIVQSYAPDVPAIALAAQHDYEGFFEAERAVRRLHGNPPFGHLVAVRVDAGDPAVARACAEGLAGYALARPELASFEVQLLGPAPAPVERARGRSRYRFLLRALERAPLRRVVAALVERIERGVEPARASVDVDPVSML